MSVPVRGEYLIIDGKLHNLDGSPLPHIEPMKTEAPIFDGSECRECGTKERTRRGWCAPCYVENKS